MSRCAQHIPGLPPADPARETEPDAEARTARLYLRVTNDQKAAWEASAKAGNIGLSDWVRDHLDDAAETNGDGSFAERRVQMLRAIGGDLNTVRQALNVSDRRLAAAIWRIEERVAQLEGIIA